MQAAQEQLDISERQACRYLQANRRMIRYVRIAKALDERDLGYLTGIAGEPIHKNNVGSIMPRNRSQDASRARCAHLVPSGGLTRE